ncbi:Mitochondrial outer membrane protein porin of 36 kDa [Capsicum chinense]|nr:Mitochondrial outer membrane protein porin of 36 kDa [Capsicum chinense]
MVQELEAWDLHNDPIKGFHIEDQSQVLRNIRDFLGHLKDGDLEDLDHSVELVPRIHLVYDHQSQELFIVKRNVFVTNNVSTIYGVPHIKDPDVSTHKTLSFDVFKVNFINDHLVKVQYLEESIGNRAFFVGKQRSFVLSTTEFPELRPGSIYFADDKYNLAGHDMGIYDYKENCIINKLESISPANSWFIFFVILTFTSAKLKTRNLFQVDVNTQQKIENNTTVSKKTLSLIYNPFTTITYEAAAASWKKALILNFRVPDRSGKLELQYLHEYSGISTSIELAANPIVNFSGVVGTNVLSLGTDVSFDTKLGTFTKCSAGLSYTNDDGIVTSCNLNDKGPSISYYSTLKHMQKTDVGLEVARSFSNNETTITAGTKIKLDERTTVKARWNNFGKATALLQHEWHPNSLFTLWGEIDTKATRPKCGWTVSLFGIP